MISKIDKNKVRLKRHARVRTKLSGTAEKPRLNHHKIKILQTHQLQKLT